MGYNRKFTFVNNYYYHIYNRGVDRRVVYPGKREFNRMLQLTEYYQYSGNALRFSKYNVLPLTEKSKYLQNLRDNKSYIDIIAYCLMPNHFHFLLKQNIDDGISKFLANMSNSYTRYFNTKFKRDGSLFQGTFKAVWVETDEQLIHLSRYIHLNPVVAGLVSNEAFDTYRYSSFNEYVKAGINGICKKEIVLSHFRKLSYIKFVQDQIDYAKRLEAIKHLTID